jgi:hypothetical protein
VLNLRQKLNIPTGAKIDFDNIQVIIDFMDSQGHPCKVEIYAEKPTYKTLFYESSTRLGYIDNKLGLTEILNCVTDIKNVKAQVEDFRYEPIANFSSKSATVESQTIKIVLVNEHYMLFYEDKRLKQPFNDFEKLFDESTGIFLCGQKKKIKLTMAEKRGYLVEIGILNRKRKRDENTQVKRKKQRAQKTTAGFVISFDYESVFVWNGTIKPYWLHYKVSTYLNEMITEGFIVAETKQEIEDNVVTRKFVDFLDRFEEETKQIVPCFRKFQFIPCGPTEEDIPQEFKYKQLFNSTTGQFGYFKT